MCGIVGYIGPRNAAELLLDGLRRLEYRGYDSAGLAVVNGKGLDLTKTAGKLTVLEEQLGNRIPQGTVGIGHTRWATHGAPTSINAHPHTDQSGHIALIHNGIIENSRTIRQALEKRGHTFTSETDTEVLTHLIGELYEDSLEEAVAAALRDVDGAYGIAVISSREPDTLVAARNGSPLLLGVGEHEWFVASDASALLAHTRSVVYLDDGEMVVINRNSGYHVRDLAATRIEKPINRIDWDLATIERGGYPHFMLKEICEQAESVENTLRGHLLEEEGTARVHGLNLNDEAIAKIQRIVITACGTSWHSGLIGEYLLEEMARIPVEVEYASEFRYRNPVVDDRTLVIAISQSGETADTLAAIREAKSRGARTVGVVNVVGSTIAREVDGGIYLHAGPEIGVASTKAFTSQVAALTLIALRFARLRDMSILQGREFIQELKRLPDLIREILERSGEVEALAARYWQATNALYLGRGVNFPTALEGALKLKEISYIHAEGYPAAEMKHGPIALIDENMPVVFIAPRDAVHSKIVSNVEEVKARGGQVIALVNSGDTEMTRLADATFTIPETHDLLTPILTSIPLQLFAYYVAVRRGCNVDQPRNLAKSVTVE